MADPKSGDHRGGKGGGQGNKGAGAHSPRGNAKPNGSGGHKPGAKPKGK
jgi:hypothetical protein